MEPRADLTFTQRIEGDFVEVSVAWNGPTDSEVHFTTDLLESHPDLIDTLPWQLKRLREEDYGVVAFKASNPDEITPGAELPCPRMRRPLTALVIER